MTQHMSLELRRFSAGISALLATERFFSGMNQHVALDTRFMFGGELAKCASKRGLTNMNQHMAFQFARSIACEVALVAIVGLLSIIQRLLGNFCKIVCLHLHVFSFFNEVIMCEVAG